jgi:hypothetical protein
VNAPRELIYTPDLRELIFSTVSYLPEDTLFIALNKFKATLFELFSGNNPLRYEYAIYV